jgi:hypothetical protein
VAVKRAQPFLLLGGLRSGKTTRIADQIGRFVERNTRDDEQGDGGQAGATDARKAVDRDPFPHSQISFQRKQSGFHGCQIFGRGHRMIRHGKRIKLETERSAEFFFPIPPRALARNHQREHGSQAELLPMPQILLKMFAGGRSGSNGQASRPGAFDREQGSEHDLAHELIYSIVMRQIIWEFRVAVEHRQAFEAFYGSEGEWALLFGRSTEFSGTVLLQDPAVAGRYLTIDSWTEASAFDRFMEAYASEYKALDAQCEELTEYEMKVGAFETL